MKKFLVIISILIFATQLHAQVGVILGVNSSGVYAEPEIEGAKLKAGAHAGFIYEKSFVESELIGFRFSAVYSPKGFNVNLDETIQNVLIITDIKTRINYIDIALMPKVKYNQLYMFAGPYWAAAVSGEQKSNINAGGITTKNTVDFFDTGYNTTDIGMQIGLGIESENEFGRAFFELNFTKGFTNLYENPLNGESLNNHNLMFSTGLIFSN